MKFNEQKAAELIEQYSLGKSTLGVWRNRGTIPDKYETGVKTKISKEDELQQQANIINAVKTEKMNISALCRLAGLASNHSLQDAVRGKSNLTKEDLTAIKKAINTSRNEVKKVLSEIDKYRTLSETAIKLLKKLFERTELQWFVILDRKKELYQKFEAWIRDKRSFPAEELNTIKSAMLVFLTETTI